MINIIINHYSKFNNMRTQYHNQNHNHNYITNNFTYKKSSYDKQSFKLIEKYEFVKILLANLNSSIECLDILYGEDLIDYFNDDTTTKSTIEETSLKINKFVLLLKREKEGLIQLVDLKNSCLVLKQNILQYINLSIISLLQKLDNIKESYDKINNKKLKL